MAYQNLAKLTNAVISLRAAELEWWSSLACRLDLDCCSGRMPWALPEAASFRLVCEVIYTKGAGIRAKYFGT